MLSGTQRRPLSGFAGPIKVPACCKWDPRYDSGACVSRTARRLRGSSWQGRDEAHKSRGPPSGSSRPAWPGPARPVPVGFHAVDPVAEHTRGPPSGDGSCVPGSAYPSGGNCSVAKASDISPQGAPPWLRGHAQAVDQGRGRGLERSPLPLRRWGRVPVPPAVSGWSG